MLSVSSALILSLNSVYFLLVPVLVVTTTFIRFLEDKSLWRFFSRTVIILLFPVIIGSVICLKNYLSTGVFSPSTISGAALSLVVERFADRNPERIRPILITAGVPDWYAWCFDRSDTVHLKEHGSIAISNYRSFGVCFPRKAKGSDTGPYDLSALRNYLETTNQVKALKKVEQDIYNMKYRKYLLAGFAPELSLNWSSLYMQQGAKIYWYGLMENPIQYFGVFQSLLDKYVHGARYPYEALHLSKLQKDKLSYKILREITSFLGNLMLYILLPITFGVIIYNLYLFLKQIKRNLFTSPKVDILVSNPVFFVLGLSVLVQTFLFSTIVGEENNRYFMYAAPYVSVVGIVVIEKMYSSIRFRRASGGNN